MSVQHEKVVDVYRLLKHHIVPEGTCAVYEYFEGEYAKDEAFVRMTDLERWDWVPAGARCAAVKLAKRKMVLKDEGWKPWGEWEETNTSYRPESAA